MKRSWFAGCLMLGACLPITAVAQENTARGTVLGGLAGALAGVAIGDHNDEAGAGALIGATVGALTGATLGSAADAEQARAMAAQQQRHWQLARAVSTADVVAMTQNGLGDEVIVNHIRENGVQRQLEVADVIALHKQGVSERVITAMQQSPVGGYAPAPRPRYRAPVIVEEHHYFGPPVYGWPHYPPRYRYHHHHPHSSFGWSMHFSN